MRGFHHVRVRLRHSASNGVGVTWCIPIKLFLLAMNMPIWIVSQPFGLPSMPIHASSPGGEITSLGMDISIHTPSFSTPPLSRIEDGLSVRSPICSGTM